MEHKKHYSRTDGFSILEHAIVMPVILFFVVGAIDVNKALQGYTALQEGVRSALRCAFPTDGECVELQAGDRTPVYDLYLRPAPSPRWPMDQFDYWGAASWLELPVTEYSDPYTTILNEGRYSIPPRPASLLIPRHPKAAKVQYWIKTAIAPYIKTQGDRITAVQSPSFSYKKGTGRYGADLVVPLQGKNLRVNKTTQSDSFTISFQVPPLSKETENLPCYTSHRLDAPGGSHLPRFSKTCNPNKLTMVLHITGTPTPATETEGRLSLSMRPGTAPEGNSLGGRIFNHERWTGNLVPRGIPNNYYDNDAGYVEFNKHGPITVNRGTKVRLTFSLTHHGDRSKKVGWKGKQVKVFFSRFKLQEQATYPCVNENALNPKECHPILPATGKEIPPKAITALTPLPGTTLDIEKRELGCIAPGKIDLAQILTTQGISNCTDCSLEFDPEISKCAYQSNLAQQKRWQCPPNNKGVAENPNIQTEAALAACPLPNDPAIIELNPKDLNLSWSEKVTHNLPIEKFEYIQTDCSKPSEPTSNDFPAELKGYQKPIRWGTKKTLPPKPLYTYTVSPKTFKEDHPKYNCSAISIQTEKYNYPINRPPTPPNLTKDSLFYGTHKLSCDWEEALHAEATAFGLNIAAYFEPDRKLTKTTWVSTEPRLSCYNRAPNYDHAQDNDTAPPILVKNGPFPKDAFPPKCENGKWICSAEFAGFSGENNTTVTRNLEYAARVAGYSTIQAYLPWTSYNCDGPNCVNLSVTENGPHLAATATLNLPLKTLLGRTITMTYRDHERLEREFSK